MDLKAPQLLKTVEEQQLIYSALCLLFILCLPLNVFALQTLITEDTGVQGKGNAEIEIGTEFACKSEDGATTKTSFLTTDLTCGLNNRMDLILSIPYHYIRTTISGLTSNEEGLADIAF